MEHMTTPITFHTRERLAPRGGNSFYLNRTVRAGGTMCGAAMTDKDWPWKDRTRVRPWTNGTDQFIPCEACMAETARRGHRIY